MPRAAQHAPPRATTAVLAAADWGAREQAHHARSDALTAGRRERAARGQTHPVDDFLFTYYSYKPGVLRRWHPGENVELDAVAENPRARWRWYAPGATAGSVILDAEALREHYGPLILNIGKILRATAGRAGSFSCFGLHEWAMVYRDPQHRHEVPLRLGQTETDAVVEAHELRCTHFDAFRFFTPDAAPLNQHPLSRSTQSEREQPGCLHAGMDLYKWAVKLGPLVPGELLLDTFELARDIRVLDMRASPYDLREWGHSPVSIETTAGKAAYVEAQRGFSARGHSLRERLLAVIAGI
ncbi:3-methyladenine DNA glycosylase (plasmid) [Coraliomargarita sp. W4R53]